MSKAVTVPCPPLLVKVDRLPQEKTQHNANHQYLSILRLALNQQMPCNNHANLVLDERVTLTGHEAETQDGVPAGLPAPPPAAFAAVDRAAPSRAGEYRLQQHDRAPGQKMEAQEAERQK